VAGADVDHTAYSLLVTRSARQTRVRRGGRVDAALGACRTDLRIIWRPLLVIRVGQLVSQAAGHR